jgi:hypothetical protein
MVPDATYRVPGAGAIAVGDAPDRPRSGSGHDADAHCLYEFVRPCSPPIHRSYRLDLYTGTADHIDHYDLDDARSGAAVHQSRPTDRSAGSRCCDRSHRRLIQTHQHREGNLSPGGLSRPVCHHPGRQASRGSRSSRHVLHQRSTRQPVAESVRILRHWVKQLLSRRTARLGGRALPRALSPTHYPPARWGVRRHCGKELLLRSP